ncbi:MAG: transcriptional repressor LexA [Candidatus Nomurabacteria bacterium]|nr:transcriptional repressor LexA [Candidatus Nomurabacteria bacterium]
MDINRALTSKQQAIYAYIRDYIRDNGLSPSLEDIRSFINVASINTVVQHLIALEKKRYIIRRKHAKRNIEIVNQNILGLISTITIPVVSSVGCDDLSVMARENYDEFLEVDSKLLGDKKDVIAVRAMGDSMNDAGIENGDYILVEPTEVAENGSKVVAIVGDMVTVKKLEKKGGVTVLWPESKNSKYRPIILQEDFKIAGKVICTIPGSSMDVSEIIPISENY